MAEASGPGPVAEAVEEQVAQQQRPSRVPATLTFQGDGAGSCPASPPGGTTMAGLTAGGSPGSPPQASGVGGHHLGWPVTGAEDTGQAMALRYAWVTRGVLALTAHLEAMLGQLRAAVAEVEVSVQGVRCSHSPLVGHRQTGMHRKGRLRLWALLFGPVMELT